MNMKYYILVACFITQVHFLEGKIFRIKWKGFTNCDYRGYVPGGKVVDVGSINAPVAKLAKTAIAAVLGPVSQASTLAMHSMNTAKAVLGAFSKVAPILGPVLGVFGAVTGIFKSLTEVKPADILRAANEAMGQLTKDVNDKLTKMKGYVDGRIITVERNLIEREFTSLFLLWTNCVREPNKEMSDECQRDAYRAISAARPKFAVFGRRIMKKQAITEFEAREVEAYLISLRNYANLILMILKPLVEGYKTDKSSNGQKYYKIYSTEMKNRAEYFIKYTELAVKAIAKSHDGIQRAGVCPKTINCGSLKQVWEGWWFNRKHTNDDFTCSCTIEDGTKQLCYVRGYIYRAGRRDREYYTFNYGNCADYNCGAHEYGGRLVVEQAQRNQQKNSAILKAYWQKEILDFIPVWQLAIKIATPGTKMDVPEHLLVYDEFSPRYTNRLNVAQMDAEI